MSPSSREINGPRPAPLKIHKDSHQIQKQPSSSTTTSSSHQQRHHPIIIYTHSPKVIHTNARDFMALVQKLTGLSRSHNDDDNDNEDGNKKPEQEPEGCSWAHEPQVAPPPPSLSKHSDISALGFDPQPPPSKIANGLLSEFPMFMHNDQFFCSPKSLYRYSSEF